MSSDLTQTYLDVGDTTPACYPDVRMGPIVWAVMCAHDLDAPAGMGWHTHDYEDIVEQWVLENATATVSRLLDAWSDFDVQPHSTRTEQKTHEKLLDEYRTNPDPTEQARLVTDGGVDRSTDTTERRCSTCGQSVDSQPYALWLFSTCPTCLLDATPTRWGDTGTKRKWVYYPRWHLTDHPDRTNSRRSTRGVSA